MCQRAFGTAKKIHAALLLLMLEAASADLVSHQPETQHLKSSAIHKNAGRLPILRRLCSLDSSRLSPDLSSNQDGHSWAWNFQIQIGLRARRALKEFWQTPFRAD